LHGSGARDAGVVKPLSFPVGIHARAPPRPFSPACSQPPGCFFT
jgi:hypothetical protein